jgi:WD40 repeat protein
VNDVRWSPTGDAIASASDDSTIRLFDLRADAELGCYQRKPVMFSCNSIDFSVSYTKKKRSASVLFSDLWEINFRRIQRLLDSLVGFNARNQGGLRVRSREPRDSSAPLPRRNFFRHCQLG